MIKRNQIDKFSANISGTATAANQIAQINLETNNNIAGSIFKDASGANVFIDPALNKGLAEMLGLYLNSIDGTEINSLTELIAINTKLLAQATAANQVTANTTLSNILLENTFRFNNGLTSTSFTAGTLVLLNTAIQTFINANPTRRFKTISTTQLGAAFNGILIHSL